MSSRYQQQLTAIWYLKHGASVCSVHCVLAVLCAYTVYQAVHVIAYYRYLGHGGLHARSQNRAWQGLELLRSDVETYRGKQGEYPDALRKADLPAFTKQLGAEQFDAQGRPLDPWGHSYEYRRLNIKVELSTLGRDGAIGGFGLDADLYDDGRVRDEIRPTLRQFWMNRDSSHYVEGMGIIVLSLVCSIAVGFTWIGVWVQLPKYKMSASSWKLVFSMTVCSLTLGIAIGAFVLFVIL